MVVVASKFVAFGGRGAFTSKPPRKGNTTGQQFNGGFTREELSTSRVVGFRIGVTYKSPKGTFIWDIRPWDRRIDDRTGRSQRNRTEKLFNHESEPMDDLCPDLDINNIILVKDGPNGPWKWTRCGKKKIRGPKTLPELVRFDLGQTLSRWDPKRACSCPTNQLFPYRNSSMPD